MLDRFKEVIERAKKLDLKTLEAFKILIFIFIGLDLFGLWWYLEVKTLAGALLIVSIIALAIILFLERRLQNKMVEDEETSEEEDKKEEPKDKEEKDSGYGFNIPDLGLPSAEEYDKRLQKAIGFQGF